MGLVPRLKSPVQMEYEARMRKRAEVMRLVEAQIAGGVDLSPTEMVDAACLMIEKINEKIYGKK